MTSNKAVVVTGAGRGLGKDLAMTFGNEGYDVVLQGRDEDSLCRVADALTKLGRACMVVVGDVTESSTLDRTVGAAVELGASVLINNAGTPSWGIPFMKVTTEQLSETFSTNFVAPMLLTRLIYPLLKETSGTVVNINSICGIEPKENRVPDCAVRWGLRGFTAAFRLEAAKDNVKVIGVYPTRIKTRPEYTYGMDPTYVCDRILHHVKQGTSGKVVLDGRPPKHTPNKKKDHDG